MPTGTLRELLESWQELREDQGALRRADPVALARAALELAHPALACEILHACAADEVGSPEARYLAALAHARVGASSRAMSMAMGLLDDPQAAAMHADALALTGRLAKDRWRRLPPGEARDAAAQQAVDCYRRAWERGGGIFPGINAATMLCVAGQRESGQALARDVRVEAGREAGGAPHWTEATLGEAALLLGEPDSAARHYAAALQQAAGRRGDVAAMRRQLRVLESVLRVPESVWDALALPRVVVFSGHMLDEAGRPAPRLPASVEPALASHLRQRLDALDAGIGYCSAACGADLLFVEALLERGGEVHITLPFARDDFVATSVAHAGRHWVERFDRALAAATSVSFGVRERFLGDESLYGYAGRLMQGAALLRARELESPAMMLAVLDPEAERLPGGTRDLVENWQRLRMPVECIDPSALDGGTSVDAPATEAVPPVEVRSHPLRRQVRTMLFADMVGFSRLSEEDTPAFLVNFLGAIAEMLERLPERPGFVNTWGDGLFMVFDDTAAGAEFALALRDGVHRTDWAARGLPVGTSLRIGMHVGPVFEAQDPIIGRRNFFGSHVVRAARIEPVAAPGSICVSAEFAAALAASGTRGLATDYLGMLPLAKSYGTGPLYRLRREQEAE